MNLKQLIKIAFSRPNLQPVYKKLHWLALKGMNYGGGADFRESGEQGVFAVLAKTYAHKPGPVVMFDVGANLGGYARGLLSELKHVPLQLHSFEPSVATFTKLRANLDGLGAMCHNLAFGKVPGVMPLYEHAELSGLSSLYKRDLSHMHVILDAKEEVEVATIDAFCKAKQISVIDFLKLDIEGAELDALKGASDMLARRAISHIQFEFGGTALDARIYLKDFFTLLSKDYELHRVLPGGLYKVARYDEALEIFLPCNYFARLRTI